MTSFIDRLGVALDRVVDPGPGYVPLSVREGGRRARAGYWLQRQRGRVALWIAPWFGGSLEAAEHAGIRELELLDENERLRDAVAGLTRYPRQVSKGKSLVKFSTLVDPERARELSRMVRGDRP